MTEPRLQYARYRDFDRSLNALWKKGGRFQKAAERIQAAVGRAESGMDALAGLKRTKHGERRVSNCVKYDLTGACRLITVQTKGYCVFAYCGDHKTCDTWLENNRGFVPVVGKEMMVTATYVSDGTTKQPKVGGGIGRGLGKLYERLPDDLFEALIDGLPRRVARAIESLDSTTRDPDLWMVIGEVEGDRRTALFDVLSLLRQDKVREATQRADLFLGRATLLDDISIDRLPDIVDSDVIRRIRPDTPTYAAAINRFMRTARYRDWMLFMHPEQERLVEEDFDGPAKLVGVSGSGKTCVVIQRAVRLARLYSRERVLVLTINRALATLISQLVEACATDEESARIDVRPFFLLCQELALNFEPDAAKQYDEVTWKMNEHVDEIWQEYYRCENNNNDAVAFLPVHDSLLARGWNPERYLREEVDWVRSALNPQERAQYLSMKRVGRTVPLTQQFRESVLGGTEGWEQKMRDIGVIDGLGLTQVLSRNLPKIDPRYRCVLVDEAQDFGNTELHIIRRLAAENPNDIFLCGDAAQAVTSKHQSLQQVGMAVPGRRSRKLSLNYRNSRDVLEAAYAILMENLTDEMLDREDFEILDPEYSSFSAATPLVLEAQSMEEEIAYAYAYARELISGRAHGKACLAVCGYSLFELTKFAKRARMTILDGSTDVEGGDLFLSDLEQTKGFEFDAMIIVNCAEGTLPNAHAPESEQFRDLARLYVAMTRAKSDLVLSWSCRPSGFLRGSQGKCLQAKWEEYLDLRVTRRFGAPERLEAHREFGLHKKPWREMTGAEFLYQETALGLSMELIAKIRQLVDGAGLIRQRRRIRWKTLGDAAEDYARNPITQTEWGPATGKELAAMVDRLEGGAADARNQ